MRLCHPSCLAAVPRTRGRTGVKTSATHRAAPAVILDVDGTRIGPVDANALVWREALAAYDHRIAFRSILTRTAKAATNSCSMETWRKVAISTGNLASQKALKLRT
jgi:hypothetical protein